MGCHYYFTLRVTSDFNPTVSSLASQTISMQLENSLFVSIVCIENCAHNIYNPQSTVQLKALCHDCDSGNIVYTWHVNGEYMVNRNMFTVLINSDQSGFEVVLHVLASDGRKGRDLRQLAKRMPPTGGNCIVKPSSGIEATTWFKFCCLNYRSTIQPINYFIYSNLVLLTICTSCDCETVLPLDAQQIKVLICADMQTCTELNLPVHIKPMEIESIGTQQDLVRLLNTEPSAIEDAKKGETQRLLVISQSIASRIKNTNQANAILDTYENIFPRSVISLGIMANVTITLANRLSPLDYAYLNVLTKSLTLINSIFKNVCEDDQQQLMIKHPFVNISRACVTILDMMNSLNKDLMPPKDIYDRYLKAFKSKTLTQHLIDGLIDQTNSMQDGYARETSLLWLESMWQTERLYRFLRLTRDRELKPSTKNNIDKKCLNITANTEYIIVSSDRRHVVRFSPELLQDTKDPNTDFLCLQVMSSVRRLNWWYPEDKRPSSLLLSVRIYAHTDNFKYEIELPHSDVRFVRNHPRPRIAGKRVS